MVPFEQKAATIIQGHWMLLRDQFRVVAEQGCVSKEDLSTTLNIVESIVGPDTLKVWFILSYNFEPGAEDWEISATLTVIQDRSLEQSDTVRTDLYGKMVAQFEQFVEQGLEAYEKDYHVSIQVTGDFAVELVDK